MWILTLILALINIVGTLSDAKKPTFCFYDWSYFQDLDFTVELLQEQFLAWKLYLHFC